MNLDKTSRYEWWWGIPILWLLIPVVLSLGWGNFFADDGYISLRFAQTIGGWADFTAQFQLASQGYTPLSPISWLVLAALAIPTGQGVVVATMISALGWGATAAVWQRLLSDWELTVIDRLIPLLLVIGPIVLLTQGSFVSWFLAISWLAIWLTMRRRWRWQTLVLALLPLISWSITAAALMIILVIWRITITRKIPWFAVGLLGTISVLILVGIGWQVGQAPITMSFPLDKWAIWSQSWLRTGEFVWLFVLLALTAVITKQETRPIAAWLLFTLLDANLIGQSVLMTGLLVLAGVGISQVARWFVDQQRLELDDIKAFGGVIGLLCLLLAVTFVGKYDRLPHAQRSHEVGEWLNRNSEAGALVIASPAVGYAADRPFYLWSGRPDQHSWAEFIRLAEQLSPDYIVTNQALFWDGLIYLEWWQDRFVLVHSDGSYDVWQGDLQPALTAETVPLNVRLENGVKLVGYQQSPQLIAPGDAVNVSLHFQVDEPLGAGFATVVWLPSPLDGSNQAQRDLLTPRGVPSNWWRPGQIVTEQFVLTTTEQISVGGYRLTVAFREQDTFDRMPVYQNDDSNPVDRIQLGYVAVPWGEEIGAAVPLDVSYGGEVQLVGANLPAVESSPAATLDIELFWQALTADRPQNDYSIFVHLLDERGEMVANADSPPQGGTYPTGAWVPGSLIPDTHRLVLPVDLPPARYEVHVGVYLPETGVRLPAVDGAGQPLPSGSLMLMPLIVR